jgi:hypothetical protein
MTREGAMTGELHARDTAASRAARTVGRLVRTALPALIALPAALGCGPAPAPEPFPTFTSWTQFDRGVDPVHPDDPTGHATVYIEQLPPHGATQFPDGTRIVRVMGVGDDPTQWEAHAMVRVGGTFNTGGALGWEFYDLSLTRDPMGGIAATVIWHGEGPPDGDGYADPDGGAVLGCNHCHGVATWNDSVLGTELTLTSF